MQIKIISRKRISLFIVMCSGLIGMGILNFKPGLAIADTDDFCQISTADSGQFSFHGGGDKQYKSTLPSQFWQEKEERSDSITLNNHLIDQAPTQILAGTNCSTDLFGSGINPGATTINNDIANVGVSIGTNASGYAQESLDKSNPSGIQIASNSGFDGNN